MTTKLFNNMDDAAQVVRELFEHCIDVMYRKNKGYAHTETSNDALDNFRGEAADNDISMLKYAQILRGKHDKSWSNFVNHGYAPDKPYRILVDRINYAFLEYLIALDQEFWIHGTVCTDNESEE